MFCCQNASGARNNACNLSAREKKLSAQLVVGPAVNQTPAHDLPVSLAVDPLCDPAVDFAVCVLHCVLLLCCGVVV
jgi:hypothetical protein